MVVVKPTPGEAWACQPGQRCSGIIYARNFEAFENDASAKQTQHLVEVLKKEGALAKAIENPGPPDFKDMVPNQPLKAAVYSRKHALELVESTGWEVESLNEPAEEIQHYMVCKPV